MRFYLLLSIVLNAVLATAQPNLFQNQVSGSVGITGGQTARLASPGPSKTDKKTCVRCRNASNSSVIPLEPAVAARS
jgi:hypothetical protein